MIFFIIILCVVTLFLDNHREYSTTKDDRSWSWLCGQQPPHFFTTLHCRCNTCAIHKRDHVTRSNAYLLRNRSTLDIGHHHTFACFRHRCTQLACRQCHCDINRVCSRSIRRIALAARAALATLATFAAFAVRGTAFSKRVFNVTACFAGNAITAACAAGGNAATGGNAAAGGDCRDCSKHMSTEYKNY